MGTKPPLHLPPDYFPRPLFDCPLSRVAFSIARDAASRARLSAWVLAAVSGALACWATDGGISGTFISHSYGVGLHGGTPVVEEGRRRDSMRPIAMRKRPPPSGAALLTGAAWGDGETGRSDGPTARGCVDEADAGGR